MAHAAARADASFGQIEKNIAGDLKNHDLQGVAEELHSLRSLDNNDQSKIAAHIAKLNDDLHSRFGFPNLDIIDYNKQDDKFSGKGPDLDELTKFLDKIDHGGKGGNPGD
jgi:hypothetical protein